MTGSNRQQPRRLSPWEAPPGAGIISPTHPYGGRQGVNADQLGDRVQPFLVSGGLTQFIVSTEPAFDPRPEGIQLVTFQYIPTGTVGFVKQVRVGPYCPPVLSDPWATSGVSGFSGTWQEFDTSAGQAAAGTNGVWRTPFGWESFFDAGENPPQWLWHLRIVQGNPVRDYGVGFNGFDITDPNTWDWIPWIPVPREAYANRGLPGSTPGGGPWTPNRMQATPDAPLQTHAMCPEDCTICLFVTWRQAPFTPRAADSNGTILYDGNNTVYPLLPSYGQLHGYMQSSASAAAGHNALTGWGG